jgi:hypothetical protein
VFLSSKSSIARSATGVLQPGESVHAAVRAMTGGFFVLQNFGLWIGLVAAGIAWAGFLFGAGVLLNLYEKVALVGVTVLVGTAVARALHVRARRAIAAKHPGAAAEALKRTSIFVALTDRRLLLFEDRFLWRPGEFVAGFPMSEIRSFLAGKGFLSLTTRYNTLQIELRDGGIFDLELTRPSEAKVFLAALEARRIAA